MSQPITIECAGGPTIQTTLAAWEAFIDAQIRRYDAALLMLQGKQIKLSKKKGKQ